MKRLFVFLLLIILLVPAGAFADDPAPPSFSLIQPREGGGYGMDEFIVGPSGHRYKIVGTYTVATIPVSPTEGDVILVTDGDSACDVTTGGGSFAYYLQYNGSAWTCIGDGGGGGTDTAAIHDNQAGEINAISQKGSALVDGDAIVGENSESSWAKIKILMSEIWTYISSKISTTYPNLDTDSTDDFDGAWSSLTGVPATASQGEMEAGTETGLRMMSPQLVAYAIAALASGGVDEIIYQSDCSSITNGFCIDTDDGYLYYYNNSSVVQLYPGGSDTIGWAYTPLSSAPGSPIKGKVYVADADNWNPCNSDATTDYFVQYNGSVYLPLWEVDGGPIIQTAAPGMPIAGWYYWADADGTWDPDTSVTGTDPYQVLYNGSSYVSIKKADGTILASNVVKTTDVDDTPVDSETSYPISSNWAYDHVAAADPHSAAGYLKSGDDIGAATATTPSAGDNDTSVATTAFVNGEVYTTETGSHAAPSTTNPLSPTWTGQVHVVFYGATGTINIPAAASYTGKCLLVYNTGAFTITLDPSGSEVVVRDGVAQTGGVSFTLSSGAGNYVSLMSDGARWVTLGYNGTLVEGS